MAVTGVEKGLAEADFGGSSGYVSIPESNILNLVENAAWVSGSSGTCRLARRRRLQRRHPTVMNRMTTMPIITEVPIIRPVFRACEVGEAEGDCVWVPANLVGGVEVVAGADVSY